MSARKECFTTKMMGYIDSTVVKFNQGLDGFCEYAKFELWGIWYHIDKDGTLYYNDTKKPVKVFYVKSGVYPEYQFCNEGSRFCIKAYHLSMLCLTDGFYDNYMSDSSLVVNHTVVEEYDNTGSYWSRNKCQYRPKPEVAFNPRYLELVTIKDNGSHSTFIHKFNLLNMFVSAKDIVTLVKQNELTNEDMRDTVLRFYSNLDMQLCF